MSAPLVAVDGLTRRFDVSKPWLNRMIEREPKKFLTAVGGVSFEIASRETYALVGESGSGKSTIGRIAVGLLSPSGGGVRITSAQGARRGGVQMIFQDPYASLNPRWRVRDLIAESVAAAPKRDGAVDERVGALLEAVGLSRRDAEKFPHEFSGGQRQRLCIARALGSEPEFIVCDEPTSALDVSVQAQVLNLMKDLQAEFGLTYLFITHDLNVVRFMADRVGVLYLGKLVEEARAADLFGAPQHPYTRMLLEAAPRIDGFDREAPPPTGEIPDPINPPSGCAYHPRCPLANERCARETPAMTLRDERRAACHAVEEGRVTR